jgi:hypothetical protein
MATYWACSNCVSTTFGCDWILSLERASIAAAGMPPKAPPYARNVLHDNATVPCAWARPPNACKRKLWTHPPSPGEWRHRRGPIDLEWRRRRRDIRESPAASLKHSPNGVRFIVWRRVSFVSLSSRVLQKLPKFFKILYFYFNR